MADGAHLEKFSKCKEKFIIIWSMKSSFHACERKMISLELNQGTFANPGLIVSLR